MRVKTVPVVAVDLRDKEQRDKQLSILNSISKKVFHKVKYHSAIEETATGKKVADLYMILGPRRQKLADEYAKTYEK